LALDLKEIGVEYAVLHEEVNVNRTLYESVLKRLNETHISNDIAISNMQITHHAELPRFPSQPNIEFSLVVGAFFGLFLGVGLAFFLEYLDVTVNTPDEVSHAIALPTLGIVPSLKPLNSRFFGWPLGASGSVFHRPSDSKQRGSQLLSKDLISSHHPLSLISESYRTIRTALFFSQPDNPPQIILLTSPQPNAGKTLTSINLAIALAQEGDSVLVIDGDLRRGVCHKMMGLSNSRGLTNVLALNLSAEIAVQKTAVPNLWLLSRGVIPPNPAALLGSERMTELLKLLRDRFRYILIDSPPVIPVSDATVISSLSEAVILVLRGKQTTTESARLAVERLGIAHSKILGVVLNDVNIADPDYAQYRSYYGSYFADDDLEFDDKQGAD
jgi:capsular exopolysaccharide synthesis family protein